MKQQDAAEKALEMASLMHVRWMVEVASFQCLNLDLEFDRPRN